MSRVPPAVSKRCRRYVGAMLCLLCFAVPRLPMAQSAAEMDKAGMELVVLGSGGPGATGRAGAGYLVLIEGKPRILVDAGPGTFVRLGESGLSMAAVSANETA